MKKIVNEQLHISNSNPVRTRFYRYKTFTYPWHFHGEYELMYVEKGQGQCLIGDSIAEYSDRCLLFFGSELPHCMQNFAAPSGADEAGGVSGVIVQFEKDFMHYSFSNYVQFIPIRSMLNLAGRGIVYRLADRPDICEIIRSLPRSEGFDQILSLLRLLHALSLLPQKELVASPNYNPLSADFKDKKIEKIIAFLNKRYTQRISLNEIASYTAMNPASFCRYFKENTGKTLKEYILDMRIGYACKLLAVDRLNISQISLECGFETITHFNRSFKRITGITPTEYKRRTLYTSGADRLSE
ncbi:AraC family transcriptional regulator [Mediterranea massiliensis]|uniref:helix-turn-helix domain-containing protein n=1 Tax=Mediterranea massiliensis TaxID=1841865 RepID=UPI0023F28F0D|nr:AraC family transcriptional regulator [Mediterranea massiliensis]